MDNYKIKVKDEAESKEAQELFVQLGYELFKFKRIGIVATEDNGTVYPDVIGNWDAYEGKELTLPQLRDLVVLKRNDINDANYRSKKVSDGLYFKTCDGIFYFMFEGKWVLSEIRTDEGLEPINQDPALISGADAMIAAIDGKDVEYEWIEGSGNWRSFNDEEWSAEDLKSGGYKFRFKPTTLTVNAELPKPSNVTLHNQNYSVTYEFKSREERNAFADKLRGTNS